MPHCGDMYDHFFLKMSFFLILQKITVAKILVIEGSEWSQSTAFYLHFPMVNYFGTIICFLVIKLLRLGGLKISRKNTHHSPHTKTDFEKVQTCRRVFLRQGTGRKIVYKKPGECTKQNDDCIK